MPLALPSVVVFRDNIQVVSAFWDKGINQMHILEIVLISILTSSISVGLAFRKYRTEKWWDKKLEVYLQVVESMNKVLVYCDRHFDKEYDYIEIDEEELDIVRRNFHEAKRHIEIQANIGRLLFNDAAYEILISVDMKLQGIDVYSSIKKILELRDETEALLSSLIAVAKNDLGAKSYLELVGKFATEKTTFLRVKNGE